MFLKQRLFLPTHERLSFSLCITNRKKKAINERSNFCQSVILMQFFTHVRVISQCDFQELIKIIIATSPIFFTDLTFVSLHRLPYVSTLPICKHQFSCGRNLQSLIFSESSDNVGKTNTNKQQSLPLEKPVNSLSVILLCRPSYANMWPYLLR